MTGFTRWKTGDPWPAPGSKTEAIIAARADTAPTVALRFGVTAQNVRQIWSRAIQMGLVEAIDPEVRGKRVSAPMQVRDVLPDTLRKALRPHAHKRGLSVASLSLRILDVIAKDSMVDAILDDMPRKLNIRRAA